MTSDTGPRICLATATTDDFLPGCAVTIASFLKHNQWFQGEIIVFDMGISQAAKAHLQRWVGKVRFCPVSSKLTRQLGALVEAHPAMAGREAQFASLEAFGLRNYDRVFYFDSDLLIQASLEELLTLDNFLLAAGDGAFLRGNGRDRDTFIETKVDSGPGVLFPTFNSGVMVIQPKAISETIYERLIADVCPELWLKTQTPHTDQFVLNRRFSGQYHPIDHRFNHVLAHSQFLLDFCINDSAVLHFNIPTKPWNPATLTQQSTLSSELKTAMALWRDAFAELLRTTTLK